MLAFLDYCFYSVAFDDCLKANVSPQDFILKYECDTRPCLLVLTCLSIQSIHLSVVKQFVFVMSIFKMYSHKKCTLSQQSRQRGRE